MTIPSDSFSPGFAAMSRTVPMTIQILILNEIFKKGLRT
jgi:hypothetical protein